MLWGWPTAPGCGREENQKKQFWSSAECSSIPHQPFRQAGRQAHSHLPHCGRVNRPTAPSVPAQQLGHWKEGKQSFSQGIRGQGQSQPALPAVKVSPGLSLPASSHQCRKYSLPQLWQWSVLSVPSPSVLLCPGLITCWPRGNFTQKSRNDQPLRIVGHLCLSSSFTPPLFYLLPKFFSTLLEKGHSYPTQTLAFLPNKTINNPALLRGWAKMHQEFQVTPVLIIKDTRVQSPQPQAKWPKCLYLTLHKSPPQPVTHPLLPAGLPPAIQQPSHPLLPIL